MNNAKTHEENEAEALNRGVFTGEEGGDERATPEGDMLAAIFIAVLSIGALVSAAGLDSPDTIWTAPGLFPIVTGVSLLAMAAGLALKARRKGANLRFDKRKRWLIGFISDEQNRRGGMLIGLVAAYVLAVDWLGFDWRQEMGPVTLRFSSYELFSMIALTLVLRMFWRETWLKCAGVGIAWSLILAAVFRYGFNILLPGSG